MTKSTKKLLLVTVFSFFFLLQTHAQHVLSLPIKYQKPHYSKALDQTQNSSFAWVVFSDHNNNMSYHKKDGKPLGKNIGFMDQFYVTDVDGDYLHVFKDDDSRANSRKELGTTAVDYGWMKSEQMLLSRFALLNDEEIPMKAILLNTIEGAKGDIAEEDFSKVKFYKDPKLTELTEYNCAIYQIFYIYKAYPEYPAKPQAYLLGTKARFDLGGRGSVKGWVSVNHITVWNHRVTLIPNTSLEGLKERKTRNITAQVFETQESARTYKDGKAGRGDAAIWMADSCWELKKFDPYIPRSPVLNNRADIEKNNGLMHIGVIGEVKSFKSGVIDKASMADINKEHNNVRAKSKNVNLVFVVDGTQSMQPYFSGVSTAITESMNQLQQNSLNNFKFAIVIYRDKDDGDDNVVIQHPLTSNYKEIANWLLQQKAFSLNDKDLPEAVYYGITTGLGRVNLPVDETNYVMLIGDACDHGDRPGDNTNVKQKDVIELLYKKTCFFTAFQVNNPLTEPYVKFVNQSKEILNQLSQKYVESNNDWYKKSGIKPPPAPAFKKQYDIERKWKLSNAPFNGFVMQSYKSSIPPENLTTQIVTTIKNINDTTLKYIDGMQRFVENGGIADSSLAPGLVTYLSRLKIPAENIKILSDKHVQLYYDGWTTYEVNSLTNPVWQYDLLLTNNDLSDLLNKLAKFPETASDNELRDQFYNTWKELLQMVLGKSNVDEFEDKSLEEIENLIFGGVGTTDLLQNKLKDILNSNKISNDKLRAWEMSIEKKESILKNIFNQVTPATKIYTFISLEEKYFWIPQILLP